MCRSKPADGRLGMLTEVVIGVESLVGLVDPQQVLVGSAEGVEDGLLVAFAVDEEFASQLGYEPGDGSGRECPFWG